jgi:large subunit ribosomal protein L1|tara:strand:+ start:620 stop:1300 length:681 start_codon:yes stop_codon:yes gene_type:complete
MSKRYVENIKDVDRLKAYDIVDAVPLLKGMNMAKFDETVEVAINLGVDPKHADQAIRGTVSLPNGTGKDIKVLVIAKGDNIDKAKDAGADYYGAEEYLEKIKGGWTDVDVIVSTPDMMAEVGKLGQILGPRGLMPNPKSGTVSNDVSKAVSELKAGKIEFRVDKEGIVHVGIGKLSFDADKIVENFNTFMDAIVKAKPNSLKGAYIKKVSISSTMGPGLRLNVGHN